MHNRTFTVKPNSPLNVKIGLKKGVLSTLLLATTMFLSACTSHYGAANINSSPPGAQVMIVDGENSNVIGHTPMTMHWNNTSDNRQTIILKLEKAGYYEKTSSFWLELRKRNAKAAAADPQLVNIEMQKVGE